MKGRGEGWEGGGEGWEGGGEWWVYEIELMTEQLSAIYSMLYLPNVLYWIISHVWWLRPCVVIVMRVVFHLVDNPFLQWEEGGEWWEGGGEQ